MIYNIRLDIMGDLTNKGRIIRLYSKHYPKISLPLLSDHKFHSNDDDWFVTNKGSYFFDSSNYILYNK